MLVCFALVVGFAFEFEPNNRRLSAAIASLAGSGAADVQDGAGGETRRAKAAKIMRFGRHLQRRRD